MNSGCSKFEKREWSAKTVKRKFRKIKKRTNKKLRIVAFYMCDLYEEIFEPCRLGQPWEKSLSWINCETVIVHSRTCAASGKVDYSVGESK